MGTCCTPGVFEDYAFHNFEVVHNNTTQNIPLQIIDEDQPDGLVGASVVMLVQDKVTGATKKKMIIEDGIDIVDAAEGMFSIVPYFCDLAINVYSYKITITYADGSIYKRLTGNYTVKK